MDDTIAQQMLNEIRRIANALEVLAKKEDSTFQTLADKLKPPQWPR